MSSLRDSVGQVIARRVRRACAKRGHFLTRFRASKDNCENEPGRQLGDTFLAECMLCKKAILIHFAPFDNEWDEEQAIFVESKRFGRPHTMRYVANGLEGKCT